MSAVLDSYAESFEPFSFIRTTAQNKAAKILMAIIATARIPLARIQGKKIMHIHYAAKMSWHRKRFLLYWGRLWGFKVVMHCHAGGIRDSFEKTGYAGVKKALGKASSNIVLSEFWKDFFENSIGCNNVYIVNNIVHRPEIFKKKSLTDHVTTFLFMGVIADRKGIFDVLPAVEHLKKQGLKFKVIVGGFGEIERFTSEVKRLGLEDYIDFRGWLHDDDKINAFNESDVLLLPSYFEGLPIAILEAMAYGRGVISTPVGGIPEIITNGENGFLVTPGNVDEIKNAMLAYIENPTLAETHGQASQNIVKKYYPETVGAQLEAIYKSILEK